MAKKNKQPDNTLIVRKSLISEISIWWNIIVFGLGIPVGGVLAYFLVDFTKYIKAPGVGEVLGLSALSLGIAVFAMNLVYLLVKGICVRRTSWTFYDGAIIYKKGRIFYTESTTRDMDFFPGMQVSLQRTIKGKIFCYGDIILTNGAGEVGDVVMNGVKKPQKVQKRLNELLALCCTRTANMMSPYKMYPQMYRNVLGGYPAYYYGNMQMQNMQQGKK